MRCVTTPAADGAVSLLQSCTRCGRMRKGPPSPPARSTTSGTAGTTTGCWQELSRTLWLGGSVAYTVVWQAREGGDGVVMSREGFIGVVSVLSAGWFFP